jgi:nucleoside phosphorylase
MSRVPVYFSHSYRREDRDINDHFWRIFYDADFSFTVDSKSTSLDTTTLELMMARSVGFVAVVTFRLEEERYQCSPFILYEYGLAVQTRQPRLVLRDRRVAPGHFLAPDTIDVEFDIAALDRCASDLERHLSRFHALTLSRSFGRRYRHGKVGIALPAETDESAPSAAARRAIVRDCVENGGNNVVDLVTAADDALALAQAADDCDFVIVDLDDLRATGIADFLLGRGTPLLKVARRGPGLITPERLFGGAPLRRAAAADQLVTYWSDLDDFASRIQQQITRAATDRTELTDFDAGHRYFRSLGREAKPVFVSNAGPVNDLARDLAQALNLENIPFFHYRFQNPIGLGQRWNDQLEQLVAASKIFVPLIDASYWKSEYCLREYAAAVRLANEGRITIVPGLLEGHATGPEVPYQGTDLRDGSRGEQVRLMVKQLDELSAADTGGMTTRKPDGPLVAGRTSVDVAIITVLEEEYAAVLRLLKRVRQVVGSPTLENQHSWVVGEVDAPAQTAPYTVALAISSRAGTNAAAITTNNTLEAFDPLCVLVVGVAGGLGGLRLGDVVVADRICAYEYGEFDHGFSPRTDLDSPTDSTLASAARTLTALYPGWYSELYEEENLRHLSPRIVVGNVASGDKAVDDPADAFFASVMRSRPKLKAVEMEGAGTAAAIQDAREKQRAVSFSMIRGISDLPRQGGSRPGHQPGQSEQTETRDSWKVAASAAAAAVAIQLIRVSWPRPPRAGSRP